MYLLGRTFLGVEIHPVVTERLIWRPDLVPFCPSIIYVCALHSTFRLSWRRLKVLQTYR